MTSPEPEGQKLPNPLKLLNNPGWSFPIIAQAGYGYGRLFFWLGLEFALLKPLQLTSGILQMKNSLSGGFSQLWSQYLHFALKPGLAIFIAGIVLYFLLRNSPKTRLDIYPAASVIAHAWIPHIGWVCLGAILTTSQMSHPILPQFGYNTAGLTPLLKCVKGVLEFGPSCIYGLLAYRSLRTHRPPQLEIPPATTRYRVLILISTILLLGATTKVGQFAFDNWKSVRPVMIDDRLPNFTLSRLDGGERLTTSNLEGKVVLLDFWATWCTPCVISMPYLEQVYQDYKDKDFLFVSVNTERTNQPAVREFLIEQELHFPVYLDSGFLQSRLRVTSYPTAILVDKKGIVRHIHIGPTSMVTLRNGIDELLKE